MAGVIYTQTGASDFLAACLKRVPKGGHLLEVGTLRNVTDAARISDGWATLTMAEWAEANQGHVLTVDIRSRDRQLREVLGDKIQRVTHVVGQAESVCQAIESVWDFAYLDGPNDPAMHLRLTEQLVRRGVKRIAYDDMGIKAPRAIHYLMAQDWNVTEDDGRHICMEAPDAV